MKVRYLLVTICLIALAGPLLAQPVQGPNGHYYEYVTTAVTWDAARTAAEGMSYMGTPGHLATLTSDEENTFVVDNLGAAVTADAWIGAFQEPGTAEPSADWQWVTGET